MSADANKDRVVVTLASVAAGGTQVHHHDFPEIRAEGANPKDAACQLINHLTRALDSALTTWRRETMERAIADVRAFVASAP